MGGNRIEGRNQRVWRQRCVAATGPARAPGGGPVDQPPVKGATASNALFVRPRHIHPVQRGTAVAGVIGDHAETAFGLQHHRLDAIQRGRPWLRAAARTSSLVTRATRMASPRKRPQKNSSAGSPVTVRRTHATRTLD